MPAAPGSVRRGGVEGRGRVDKGVAGKRTEERYPSQPRPGQWGEGGGVEGRGRVDKGVAGKRTEERYPSQPHPGQ